MTSKGVLKTISAISWGISTSLGHADGKLNDFELMLPVIRRIIEHMHVYVPLTTDIESDY